MFDPSVFREMLSHLEAVASFLHRLGQALRKQMHNSIDKQWQQTWLRLGPTTFFMIMQILPEKEAKAIASQIFDGLAYLNGPSRRIIHYDLKPANILFNELGEVKITVSPCL